MTQCPVCQSATEANANYGGDACSLLISAYILAGLAMMLNIRLSYSSAPYALIRFKLPENLFSVFVRRMASALELWCLPSMLLGNIIDLFQKLLFDGPIVRALECAKPYDIQNDTNLGSGLSLKATELRAAAEKLQTRAVTAGGTVNSTLASPAETLATEAGKLATDHSKASTNAGGVIDKYKALEGAYDKLKSSPADQAKVAWEYFAVKQIYDRILNLTKLEKKAIELYGKAETLANAKGLEAKPDQADTPQEQVKTQLRDLANGLKDAVGEERTGLRRALKDLKGEAETNKNDLVTKVLAVVTNFKAVKSAYGNVTAKETQYKSALTSGEDETQKYTAVTSAFNDLNTAYDHIIIHDKPWKFYWIILPSIICQWLNFLTYVILLIVYLMGGDQGHLTLFYFVIAISGVVFGINMTLVYSVDFYYIPVYIAGENSFPIVTSFIHYVATLLFGNRRKYNSDFILVNIDIWVAIIISFVAAGVWTYGYLCEGSDIGQMKHIHAHGFGGDPKPEAISPFLMIVVGMGLVYAIYPGIAPGMIVPFYLIDKIGMALLILTTPPPLIFVFNTKFVVNWFTKTNYVWNGPDDTNNGFGGWTE